ncbi:MBL fold metallo-hydrolase [Aneurinibacillus aneurinilyticus]|jgi:phosphoribosyl 1,2-cyclic phosphate phosphodiesterase|uniref:MBL fold metallo-hydrolase n=1 Tax=Aneurinibacillus aneurinilyticus TaxID=1391 RepID=UPI0023F73A7B|nr:MBL fold metallo-hydrolase [Aneurinibacillus aneurinilyticus]MCI1696817.1 MBL fold metallo-hydrolase [Aneurinibacillus aneurinilyticus]
MGKLTFLGTSDAQGVPRLLCSCRVCQSKNTLNVRKRPSVLLETKDCNVLIDISPDFRSQFIEYVNNSIPDIVLITHCHHDHIGGLGDYADLCFWNNKNTKIVSPPENIDSLKQRFPYLINRRGLSFVSSFNYLVEDWKVTFHKVNHGFNGYSYGILFEKYKVKWAYLSDAFNLNEQQFEPFYNCDLLILGTSYWKEIADHSRRSVYDVQEAIKLKDNLNISRLILTHLSHDIDLSEHNKLLPHNVEFAYDGMKLPLVFN